MYIYIYIHHSNRYQGQAWYSYFQTQLLPSRRLQLLVHGKMNPRKNDSGPSTPRIPSGSLNLSSKLIRSKVFRFHGKTVHRNRTYHSLSFWCSYLPGRKGETDRNKTYHHSTTVVCPMIKRERYVHIYIYIFLHTCVLAYTCVMHIPKIFQLFKIETYVFTIPEESCIYEFCES